ncbi:transcriptional regulator [Clohesyomyces aquaticus]|uniref:Transcriptional regulator n=1 Tax=Clohesyomyces aquaticus TaxID=1231657 RepID=A0A1Y2A476_9PLEO|nr:transcriptional regulator [Clohesyomyces aquaticus]
MSPVFNVLAFIYPGNDILDFSAPVEIFSTNPPSGTPRSFEITTFAHSSPVKASAGALTYQTDVLFSEIENKIEEFDILLIPGAGLDILSKYLSTEEGTKTASLISKFAELKPREEIGHRIIMSVCTGAILLGASGILANHTVTTHHFGFDMLKQIADKAAGGDSKIDIVKKRWVDVGFTDQGVRIVTAGGVTSGLDASLWVVETLVGKESAKWTADIVEFERRGRDDGWGA